jgi:hypothetical protein
MGTSSKACHSIKASERGCTSPCPIVTADSSSNTNTYRIIATTINHTPAPTLYEQQYGQQKASSRSSMAGEEVSNSKKNQIMPPAGSETDSSTGPSNKPILRENVGLVSEADCNIINSRNVSDKEAQPTAHTYDESGMPILPLESSPCTRKDGPIEGRVIKCAEERDNQNQVLTDALASCFGTYAKCSVLDADEVSYVDGAQGNFNSGQFRSTNTDLATGQNVRPIEVCKWKTASPNTGLETQLDEQSDDILGVNQKNISPSSDHRSHTKDEQNSWKACTYNTDNIDGYEEKLSRLHDGARSKTKEDRIEIGVPTSIAFSSDPASSEGSICSRESSIQYAPIYKPRLHINRSSERQNFIIRSVADAVQFSPNSSYACDEDSFLTEVRTRDIDRKKTIHLLNPRGRGGRK